MSAMEPPLVPSGPLPTKTGWRGHASRVLIGGVVAILLLAFAFKIDVAAPLNAAVRRILPFSATPAPQGTPSVLGSPATTDDADTAQSELGSAISAITAAEKSKGQSVPHTVHPAVAPGIAGAAQRAGLVSNPDAVKNLDDAQRIVASLHTGQPDTNPFGNLASIDESAQTPPQTQPAPQPTPQATTPPQVPIISTPAPVVRPSSVVTVPAAPALLGVTPGQQSGFTPQTIAGLSVAQQAAFLGGNGDGDVSIYTQGAVEAARSSDEVWPTDPIDCLLMSTISTEVPGQVVGMVTRDVVSHLPPHRVLIPATTLIWGAANSLTTQGQARMQVRWDVMVFPNGATLALSSVQASDTNGQAGLAADVNDHRGRVYFTTLVASALSALGGITQARAAVTGTQSFGQLFGVSAENGLQTTAGQAISNTLAQPPTLGVSAGTAFQIHFAAIQVLPPYASAARRYAPPSVREGRDPIAGDGQR